MIPNITRGQDMTGLMCYLAGPGKHNEHTNQHLVAGNTGYVSWFGDEKLSRADAKKIGAELNKPAKTFNVNLAKGHVWHCSLSLPPADGVLTDSEWEYIASQFVKRMGFVNDNDPDGSLRWVAARHGLSGGGNDHIHIAVNLVYDDGQIHNLWPKIDGKKVGDWSRAQNICRALEKELGLSQVAQNQRGERGYKPSEIEAATRRAAKLAHKKLVEAGIETRSWDQLTRDEREQLMNECRPREAAKFDLARKVRAASSASADEAEFVRRVRRAGIWIRPRFAKDTQDVVVGYKVAFKPPKGTGPIWYGGGHLSKDLSLPRLREAWPDTPQQFLAASAEWRAAWRGLKVVAPGRETLDPLETDVYKTAMLNLARLNEKLQNTPADDHVLFSKAASDLAGGLTNWALNIEQSGGPITQAADALKSVANLKRSPLPRPVKVSPNVQIVDAMIAMSKSSNETATARKNKLMMIKIIREASSSIATALTNVGDQTRAQQINKAIKTGLDPMIKTLAIQLTQAKNYVQQSVASETVLAAKPENKTAGYYWLPKTSNKVLPDTSNSPTELSASDIQAINTQREKDTERYIQQSFNGEQLTEAERHAASIAAKCFPYPPEAALQQQTTTKPRAYQPPTSNRWNKNKGAER